MAGVAMNTSFDLLFEIAWRFASLSLLAIGGINALLPEFHRVVVDIEGWMTSAEFADLFALAQLAPGPNAMVVSLLGWKVAGISGAFVATIAACGPSSLVSYFAMRALERMRNGALRVVLQRALAPVAIGLVLASGYTLANAADRSVGALALTVCGAAAIAATRVNPIWVLAAAALAGVAGIA
jgi:chromate transporter